MILIGSHALKAHHEAFVQRQPKDYDLICTMDEFQAMVKRLDRSWITEMYPTGQGKKMVLKFKNGAIFEFEIAWLDSTAHSLANLLKDDWKALHNYEIEIPTGGFFRVTLPPLNVLYTIKRSHRYLKNSPHFLKTMTDLRVMEFYGASVPEQYAEWLKERQKATYTYSHPKLNVTKASFFNSDQVTYTYDHDSIHEVMAAPAPPAYTLFKDDLAEVKCSPEKFFALPEEDRLRSVREESEVLALERSQVPWPGKLTPRQSFLKALEKVCTSISSGWWREYAYENYHKVVATYRPDYLEIFQEGVKSGAVRPFDASKPTLY